MGTHKIFFTGLVSAGIALASGAASAAQDIPVHENGVTIVCTGVGSAKTDPRWSSYPVKLVFANTRGEDVAGEHVTLWRGDQTVLQTACDAPWLLLRAPAGHYRVSASLNDAMGIRRAVGHFSTAGSSPEQKTATLEFPARQEGAFS